MITAIVAADAVVTGIVAGVIVFTILVYVFARVLETKW
jgi:hypothetical protein